MSLHQAYQDFYLLLIWMGKPFNGVYGQQLLVEYQLGLFAEHRHPELLKGMGAITSEPETGRMDLTAKGEEMLLQIDPGQVEAHLARETTDPEALRRVFGKIEPRLMSWKSNRADKID